METRQTRGQKRKSENSIDPAAKRAKQAKGAKPYANVWQPTIKGMDMLFLCGAKEEEKACVPLKNSDVLLSFLKLQKYASHTYAESIFETLQQMIPTACFLHPINLEIYENENSEYTTKLTIARHAGKKDFIREKLNLKTYKKKVINKCFSSPRGPLMAIPLGLRDGDDAHANMLIIDTNKKTFEHFEPHGKYYSGSGYSKINHEIERVARELCKEWFPDYTYIPRDDATDFQSILNRHFAGSEHGGTCMVWSIWYAYLRLSHPEFEREEIIKQSRELLGRENFAELERFIMEFILQLNSILDLKMIRDSFYNVRGRRYPMYNTFKLDKLLRKFTDSYPDEPSFNDADYDLIEKKHESQSVALTWIFTNLPTIPYSLKFGAQFALLADVIYTIQPYVASALTKFEYFKKPYVASALTKFEYFKNDGAANAGAARAVKVKPKPLGDDEIVPAIHTLLEKIVAKTLNDNDVKQIGVFLSAVLTNTEGYGPYFKLDEEALEQIRPFMTHFQKDNDMHLGMVYVVLLRVLFEYFETGAKSAEFKKEMYEKIYHMILKHF